MDDQKMKFLDGIALALALLICSIILYLNPLFLGHKTVTSIVGILFGVIGFAGFMQELSRTSKNEILKSGQIDIASAAVIGVLAIVIHYYFSHWAVNILIIFFLLMAFYGFFRGMLKVLLILRENRTNWVLKIPMVILHLAVFTLTTLQLLQILKVIDK
ncbi:hypothetical protein [Bacillus sp. FJAT-27245]|uniref:hypothetical protein n=1 Tax=Bacillus sp. FJAT-27245 TaxID=1684144 RepID=UPI0006A798F5|nr:hypothetical protein [Bacillus sp. FJAT-27245]